jgi:hypothetical protein
MIKYRNISFSAKTFYGVKFEPGEVKSVPGYINCPSMVRVFTKSKPNQDKPKTSEEFSFGNSKRGRKKSNESESVSFAETENKIEISKEETSDGN